MKRMTAALALTAGLTLAACSDGSGDEDSAPSDKSSSISLDLGDLREMKEWEDQAPPCSEVWIDGEKLPEGYDGCKEENGTIALATTVPCADGLLDLAYYGDRHWTRPADGTIVDGGAAGMAVHPDYAVDMAACNG